MPPKLIPMLLKRVQEVRIIATEEVYFTGEMSPSILVHSLSNSNGQPIACLEAFHIIFNLWPWFIFIVMINFIVYYCVSVTSITSNKLNQKLNSKLLFSLLLFTASKSFHIITRSASPKPGCEDSPSRCPTDHHLHSSRQPI